ncbi:MAG: pilin [Patescibacteria group bacterium]
MRKFLVVTITLIVLGSLRIPAVQAIECDSLGILDCDNAEILVKCPVMCVARCTQLLPESGQIIDHPEYCVTCAKVALLPIGGPLVTLMAGTACTAAAGEAIHQATCETGPGGCCIETVSNNKIPKFDKECKEQRESCAGQPGPYYSCCLCENTDSKIGDMISTERETFDSCKGKCEAQGMTISRSFGAGNLPKSAGAKAPTPAALASVNAMCFTRAECATKEYGGSTDAFREGYGCPSSKGRCIAPEPQIPLSIPLGSVGTVQGLRGYIASAFQYGVSIVAIFAAVMFVYGGFRYIFGSAFGDIKRGKEIMIDASVGMLLVLGSYTILWTINPATLELKRLEVFMINKQVDVSSKWCRDLKKITGKDDLKFMEADGTANEAPAESAAFTVATDDTRCNVKYFAEGLTGSPCYGHACDAPGKGYACADCTGGRFEECAGKTTGYACVKASWTGTVTWTEGQQAEDLTLYAVCGYAQADTFATTEKNMFEIGDVELTDSEGFDSGTAPYRITIKPEEVADAEKKCSGGENAFRGFVLALEYYWTEDALFGRTIIGGSKIVGPVMKKFGGIAIVTHADCGSSGKFSGYTGYSNDGPDAYWCGLKAPEAKGGSTKLMNTPNYWSLADLKGAADGGATIQCDINLNTGNAPDAPDKKFYGTECEGGTTF